MGCFSLMLPLKMRGKFQGPTSGGWTSPLSPSGYKSPFLAPCRKEEVRGVSSQTSR